jgi:hypothetical protein
LAGAATDRRGCRSSLGRLIPCDIVGLTVTEATETMTQSKPVKVAVKLPNAALPQADWADCYQLDIPENNLSAIDAAKLVLGRFPLWVRLLMRLRNIVVAPFGLKSSGDHSPGTIEMVGPFPVLSQSAQRVVLGFNDRHLDFRIIVDVANHGGRQTISVATLVRRKIMLGKIYIAAITPFHRLIVIAILSRLGQRLSINQRPSR